MIVGGTSSRAVRTQLLEPGDLSIRTLPEPRQLVTPRYKAGSDKEEVVGEKEDDSDENKDE